MKWTGFVRKYFNRHFSSGIPSLLLSAAGSTMPWFATFRIRTVQIKIIVLYRLDKQYSPISAIASLYYLFDTIGIYHCKIYKILAYYINHIGIT
jgi:hypothetical protein